MLAKSSIPFNPKGLTTFEGPHVFDVVYTHPPTKPEMVVVIEAKGGTASCGTRDDPLNPGKKVKQGTPEYLKGVSHLMANSSHKDPKERKRRRDVGKAIQNNIGNNKKPKVIYHGVRGGYKGTSGLYEPEGIFTKTL